MEVTSKTNWGYQADQSVENTRSRWYAANFLSEVLGPIGSRDVTPTGWAR